MIYEATPYFISTIKFLFLFWSELKTEYKTIIIYSNFKMNENHFGALETHIKKTLIGLKHI